MPLPYQFANATTLVTAQLDANYNALGALTPIPCGVSGTNAITLTPAASTPTVSSFSNYQQFTGIASATNTSSVSAVIGALPSLPVYKDTPAGPAALTGGEIVSTCGFGLIYDSALNAGNGGFHLCSPAGYAWAPNGTISTPLSLAGGAAFGGTASLTTVLTTTSSLSWPSIPANLSSLASVYLPGASVGDVVVLGTPASLPTGVVFFGWVSSVSTVSVRALNATASSVTPTAGVYRIAAHRYAP